jgi:hypothetical protein
MPHSSEGVPLGQLIMKRVAVGPAEMTEPSTSCSPSIGNMTLTTVEDCAAARPAARSREEACFMMAMDLMFN